jgi:hypothetical protein
MRVTGQIMAFAPVNLAAVLVSGLCIADGVGDSERLQTASKPTHSRAWTRKQPLPSPSRRSRNWESAVVRGQIPAGLALSGGWSESDWTAYATDVVKQ